MTRGFHIISDYKWIDNNKFSNDDFHTKLYDEIEKIINKTSLKIVHKNLCLLPIEGHPSEIGATMFFNMVFQLDSSHFSLHSYGESKLLAIDVFGCGSTNLYNLMKDVDDLLLSINPTFTKTFSRRLNRFNEF